MSTMNPPFAVTGLCLNSVILTIIMFQWLCRVRRSRLHGGFWSALIDFHTVKKFKGGEIISIVPNYSSQSLWHLWPDLLVHKRQLNKLPYLHSTLQERRRHNDSSSVNPTRLTLPNMLGVLRVFSIALAHFFF